MRVTSPEPEPGTLIARRVYLMRVNFASTKGITSAYMVHIANSRVRVYVKQSHMDVCEPIFA